MARVLRPASAGRVAVSIRAHHRVFYIATRASTGKARNVSTMLTEDPLLQATPGVAKYPRMSYSCSRTLRVELTGWPP